MPLVLGDWSPTITHEYRPSDVRVLSISAPVAGSTQRGDVTVTFVLQSFEAVTCDVALKFTLDGDTVAAASVTGAVTGLACSAAGTQHTLTWHSVTDVGSAVREDNVQIGIVADDTDDDDQVFWSEPFVVDNLPTSPEFVQDDGEFRKDLTYPIVFTISTQDPGANKLFPKFQADLIETFDSDRLVTEDSSDGTAHARFDHRATGPTLKPVPGYYVSGIAVSGATALTWSALLDLFSGEALPGTIADAQVIIVPRTDRRVYLSALSATGCTLTPSVAGLGTALVDLFVMSDPTTQFYVKSDVAIIGTTFATVDFSALGTDDLGQAIPATIDPAPRIMIVDQVERMGILGAVTTTGVALKKSVAGPGDGLVTVIIAKSNASIYQDDAVSVPDLTPTAKLYSALSDGGALPAYIPGAIAFPVPRTDRHIYIGEPVGDQVKLARSVAGVSGEWIADVNIWTTAAAADFWQPMSATGIPTAYLSGAARWRPASGLDLGKWYLRVAFGNLT